MEFRAFVKENAIIGICQRDNSAHYPFIEGEAGIIEDEIEEFYHSDIEGKFPLGSFVFDVYLEKKSKGPSYYKWLIDFSPWLEATDPLFFTWPELDEMTGAEGEGRFRFERDAKKVGPTLGSYYKVPVDFEDKDSMEQFMKEVTKSD